MPSALVSFVLNGISSRSEIKGSRKRVYERLRALRFSPWVILLCRSPKPSYSFSSHVSQEPPFAEDRDAEAED
jgi:hypothetical protein